MMHWCYQTAVQPLNLQFTCLSVCLSSTWHLLYQNSGAAYLLQVGICKWRQRPGGSYCRKHLWKEKSKLPFVFYSSLLVCKRTNKQAVQNNLIYSVRQTQDLAEKNRSPDCMPAYDEKAQGTAVFQVFSMTFIKLFGLSVSQVHTWQGVVVINRRGWKQRGGEQPSSSRRHWGGLYKSSQTSLCCSSHWVSPLPIHNSWTSFPGTKWMYYTVSSITCSYSDTYFCLAMLTGALGLTLFPDQPLCIVCLLPQS